MEQKVPKCRSCGEVLTLGEEHTCQGRTFLAPTKEGEGGFDVMWAAFDAVSEFGSGALGVVADIGSGSIKVAGAVLEGAADVAGAIAGGLLDS